MPTITIQIGNSDDKLTQKRWAAFVAAVDDIVRARTRVHFRGGSRPDAPWQNYCWVFDLASEDDLRNRLADVARRFDQESIALTIGDTVFVKP